MNYELAKVKWFVRALALLITFHLSLATALAQSESGLLLGAEAEKKLTTDMSLSLGVELRTRNDFKTMDRWSGSLGVDYKLAKWLKADASYTLLRDNNREKIANKYWRPSYWGTRHRLNASLTGSTKLFGTNLKLSLRERWQYTYRPSADTERYYFSDYSSSTWTGTDGWTPRTAVRNGKGKNQLRSRLEIEYDRKRAVLKPYASVELYNSWGIEKVRYTVGSSLKLSKQHSFDLYYRYQDQRHVDENDYDPDMHYLGVAYKFKF